MNVYEDGLQGTGKMGDPNSSMRKIKRMEEDEEITETKKTRLDIDYEKDDIRISGSVSTNTAITAPAVSAGEIDSSSEFSEEQMEQIPNLLTSSIADVEPQVLPEIKYEYLDHTADVQLHAWGDTLQEAFEQCAMAMFAYMTDIERVDNFGSTTIEAQGHDMLSLLYGFLDEFLFTFNADPYFISRKVQINSFDRENFKITATGFGETFALSKHPQGTEVKAITYSNMQFHESENYAEVFVIIDI